MRSAPVREAPTSTARGRAGWTRRASPVTAATTCGYVVGLGFPPSWTGGSMVVGLRHASDLVLPPGMVFHLLSWLMGTGRGDYFFSNAAVLTDEGCEILTTTPRHSQVV